MDVFRSVIARTLSRLAAALALPVAVALAITLVEEPFLMPWLHKPRPSIQVSRVGFSGPAEDEVMVPLALAESAMASLLLGTNDVELQYVTLTHLTKRADQLIAELNAATGDISTWKDNVPIPEGVIVDREALTTSPFFTASTVVQVFLVAAAERLVLTTPPPLSLRQLKNGEFPQIVPFSTGRSPQGACYVLSVGGSTCWIPVADRASAFSILLAESVSRGAMRNIIWYLEQFSELASGELLHLQQFVEGADPVLFTESRLSAVVQLRNDGRRAAVFQPEFTFSLDGGGIPDLTLSPVVAFQADPRITVSPRSTDHTPIYPFVVVPPESQVEVQLISTKPLGSDAKAAEHAYAQFLVAFTVSGRVDSDSVESPPRRFGGGAQTGSK